MVEQRKSRRFALETDILWRPDAAEGAAGPAQLTRTRDLSTGGFCAALCPGIATGHTLQIEIRLPSGQSIYSLGKVAWVSDHARIKGWDISACEAGIEFLNLTGSDKLTIDRFVSESYGL